MALIWPAITLSKLLSFSFSRAKSREYFIVSIDCTFQNLVSSEFLAKIKPGVINDAKTKTAKILEAFFMVCGKLIYPVIHILFGNAHITDPAFLEVRICFSKWCRLSEI